jgi:uncharacterized protein (TIGR03437 family)
MTLYTDGSLQPGTYDGTFTVTAPGMDNSPLTVPVHAVVGPGGDAIPPWIVISGDGIHSLLNFGAGITISSATPWIVPRPDGSDALIDESLLSAGMNTGYVTITTSGVGARSYQVTVYVIEGSYAGAMPQDLAAGPSNLSFLAEAGDTPKHATVAVWPANPVRQSFTARVEAQWLAASPSAGSAPSTVALTADPSGLQPGTYTTHLDIVSDQAANGTVRIPVTLTVQSQVPFNVDPAGVGVWNVAGAVPPTVQFDLTGDQPMTYQANASELFVYGIPPGSTPGQLSIALGPCSACAGDLELTTSGNDVRRVPVVEWSYPDVLFPLINAGGIVNDATFSQGPVAPGSIIAVFGTQLASSEYVAAPGSLRYDTPPDGPGFFPSDDDPFGVFYRSPNQWNLQVPTTLAPGTYRLWIGTSGTSAPAVFTVAPIAPYVFTWGANRGAVLNQDGSLNTPNHQAPAGSAIEVYLTGQGAVSPPVPTRQAAPASPLSYVSATTTATIDGVSASVPFAGLAPGFVGLCQVNVDIPGGLSPGQHKLVIDIAGVKTNEVNFDSN